MGEMLGVCNIITYFLYIEEDLSSSLCLFSLTFFFWPFLILRGNIVT
jgi:hypothetical protein